ncbi:MAG: site-specific DNA-methyltransferase [Phaeodactylibacter sp.]|uniref:site-specific DNA-methyltransferase n=1 Tax=Phaeodactylibacter sp. TaxID=1940289 RepID=UPI0032EB3027
MPTLQFKGKNIIWNHHLSVPYHSMDEVDDLHYQPEKGQHQIIEGDNLVALKAMLPKYAGEVKCIYIDPPYNTGNEEWVYSDKVNSPLIRDWLNKIVSKDDLTKHDKWLCMMAPRLKMLRELLSEDGLIFISIDDYEIHNLRSICNEIFDEENLIANFTWRTDGNFDNQAKIKINHEYVLCYAFDKSKFEFPEIIDPNVLEDSKLFNDDIVNTIVKNGPKNPISSITLPKGFPANFENGIIEKRQNKWPHFKEKAEIENYKLKSPVEVSSGWSSKRLFELYLGNNLQGVLDTKGQITEFYLTENGAIEARKKREINSHVISSLVNLGSTQAMSAELKEMAIDFDYPKPTSLIKYLLQVLKDKNCVILDSFAGSGTTMHAVMQLNKEDGGNRQCIMVQMPENSESEPDKNVCRDITRQRVKLAIEKHGFSSGFKYLRVGSPIDPETMLDGDLPTYQQFAEYVYYLATGGHLADKTKVDASKHFVGIEGGQAVYLIYEQDMDKLSRLALTLQIAESIVKHSPGKRRVVFAPSCFLDEEYMTAMQIEFVSVPYNLFERKNNG